MRIGDLSERSGVSRRLLRYYEEQGLLTPVRRANGYRDYAESDVAAVRHIRLLLEAGLPTVAIGRLLHCVHDDGGRAVPTPCPGLVEQLRRERGRIAATIADLQASQRALDGLLATALNSFARTG
ncbi:MerR family transcriptional regulator [Nonomuraea soli]|uniref:DNA-binding transcriptional MerR regulator n=1 Tax=Nonomuraea soli TaxID=1032476 RepID=A0A7W0CSP2_9ACTN|nr:MerR family transcriptional regulator [Nonomuraea soli]MBA2896502.1 DNA-binding transcriptional MerR regulator [Nonomuraea soli]